MNKQLEAAAEKYITDEYSGFSDNTRLTKKDFIAGANYVKETELKEAMELIDGLKKLIDNAKLHHGLVSLTSNQQVEQLSEVDEIIAKAEQFLTK